MSKAVKHITNTRKRAVKPHVEKSEDVMAEIFGRIAGGESVRSICSTPDMPTVQTVLKWIDEDGDLKTRYTTALHTRAFVFAEEIMLIADEVPPRTSGGGMDSAFVTWQKSRVNARQWVVSRLLPKIYGDRVDLTHKGDAENPLLAVLMAVQGTALPVYSGPYIEEAVDES